ncbi:MAG: hypothetical protein ACLQGP_08805 [Isosphaeraceae bacterium]
MPAPANGGGGGPPPSDAKSKASQEISNALNELIIDATARFRPLDYEYDEDLLKIVDRVEAYLSGKTPAPPSRVLPKLDVQEEMDHFRETFRRWKARTGKDLRVEIDRFAAEVAARKPDGPRFYPDFHKRFAAVFDDLIPIEVAEIRERRNRYLHEQARPLLDSFRQKDPDAVLEFEKILNQPPYNLSPSVPATDKTS